MRNVLNFVMAVLIAAVILPVEPLQAAHAGNNIVVRLVGTAAARPPDLVDELPIIQSGPLCQGVELCLEKNTLCFDLDLVNAKTGRVIGSAADCLSDINGVEYAPGISLTGSTFFHFASGLVVSQGKTTVQPVLPPPVPATPPAFTHITGAIPDASANSVIYGERRFRRSEGPVRLSGAVNLSGFGGAVGDPITFDCVFILDI